MNDQERLQNIVSYVQEQLEEVNSYLERGHYLEENHASFLEGQRSALESVLSECGIEPEERK